MTFEFGDDGARGSTLKDVAIVNDSNIWAVGEIYLNDSTGQPDPTRYNLIVWDGVKWEIKRVPYYYQGEPFYNPIQSVFSFSSNDIWFCGNGVINWDGKKYTPVPIPSNILGSYQMNKIWGRNSNNFYIIENGGNIANYQNNNWSIIISSTTTDLLDIWGNSDGSTIWACGYDMDYSQSCILKFDGSDWQTIWSTHAVSTPPYDYLVSTIWAGDTYLYVGAGDGIYRTPLKGNDSTQKVLSLQLDPHRIRGSAENNMAVACDDGSIWHYNGATWFQETPTVLFRPLYSIAVSENTIIGVGFDATKTNIKGIILMGRRN